MADRISDRDKGNVGGEEKNSCACVHMCEQENRRETICLLERERDAIEWL